MRKIIILLLSVFVMACTDGDENVEKKDPNLNPLAPSPATLKCQREATSDTECPSPVDPTKTCCPIVVNCGCTPKGGVATNGCSMVCDAAGEGTITQDAFGCYQLSITDSCLGGDMSTTYDMSDMSDMTD